MRSKSPGWRFWECVPMATSLFIILLPIVTAGAFPRFSAVFTVLYVFFWFLFALEYTVILLLAFYRAKRAQRIRWNDRLHALQDGMGLSPDEDALRHRLFEEKDWIDPTAVRHLVLLATCGEDLDILRETVRSLVDSDFDLKRIFLCLATEERMRESGEKNALALEQEFSGIFGRFFWIEHPDGIAGEVRGKGGNITHAGRETCRLLEEEGEDISNIVVTTLDADNKVDRQYFAALTFHFCLRAKRQQRSYQPIPLFYNNIWDVPLLNRMLAIGSGFWHMIESGRPDRLRNFASHGQPLQALKEMDFWAVHTIVEDGHQFWRSYLHFRGDYEVVPIFIPIYQDAVLNKNYYRSLLGQYKQMRRWAWGCSDIPFCAHHFWKWRNELPRGKTFLHFLRLLQGHVMWATAALFITLSIHIPQYFGGLFPETTVASNLEYLVRIFLQIALIGVLVSMAVSLTTLPPAPSRWKRLSLVWQWLLLPVMTILMGSVPALEAQTRLAFRKPLEFNVTEKIRKKGPEA